MDSESASDCQWLRDSHGVLPSRRVFRVNLRVTGKLNDLEQVRLKVRGQADVQVVQVVSKYALGLGIAAGTLHCFW